MEIRCANCKQWLGESHEDLEFRGTFAEPRDRLCLPEPRGTWRCGKCGWATIFAPRRHRRDRIELKNAPGGGSF